MNENLEIYLNSKTANQRVLNEVGNCYFYLPNIEINTDTEEAYISVRNAVIPFSWYSVNSTNNIFSITWDGVLYNLIIPNGNYNINTLRTQISDLVNNIEPHGGSHVLTTAYNPKTNKITFSSVHHSFTIMNTSTCYELIGLKEGFDYTSSLIGGANILTSNISVNLFVIRTIYVASDNFILSNINQATPQNSSILASIPVVGNPNNIIHYENTTAKHKIHHLNNINNLHIKLIDQDGDIIQFNDVNWSMTLEITIVKKVKNNI